MGKGCDVKGKIVSSDGDTVSWFESFHIGMGKLNLLPIYGKKYYAIGMVKNKFPFKTELAEILPEGFSMLVQNNDTAVLDNMTINRRDDYVIYALSMEQVDRILISKSDPLADSPTLRNRYVISIYTKPGAIEKKEFYTISEQIAGYDKAREFYSPTYTKPKIEGERQDLRTTIYWNHSISTDENGEATVKFYNADKPAYIRVQAEGMNEQGIPVMGRMVYVVR